METTSEATEIIDDGEKRGRRGRVSWPKERREELLAGYEGRGMSQAAFARRAGVRYPKAVCVALKLIGRLYRLEREWDEADAGANRVRDVAGRARLRAIHFARTLRWLHAFALSLRSRPPASCSSRSPRS